MNNTIEIKNLGKRYTISHEKEAMIRHILPGFLGIKKREQFWALRNINLKVSEGECIGIIGRNGSGKSTLLSSVAGITYPTEGQVECQGRISTVLILGAGFHSELTGEENIFLNASLFGLSSKEIRNKFDAIVEFSELKDFIDAPVKVYSTGMYLRLGFSIAIHSEFDILLLDEVISVGDIGFQGKCVNKIREFKQQKKTVLIISQLPSLLRKLCDRVVLLDKGKIECIGIADEVINRYEDLMQKKDQLV